MPELLQEYWILVVIALVIGVIVAWWVFAASRKTRVEVEERPDGEAATKRNQALIDAPPAAAGSVPASETARREQIGDVAPGELSAAANLNETAHAGAVADAEAGAPGSARDALDDVPARSAEEMPEGDDLTRIKGIGPKLVTLLGELGVTSFAQIAAWDETEIARIDRQLGRFQGRIERDNWVEQARLLATGDNAGYEAQFGRL